MPATIRPPSPKQRFLAHLTGTRPGAPPLLPRPTTAALVAIQDEAGTLCAELPKVDLGEERRSSLQGKRTAFLLQALHLCGTGLQGAADFAAAIGVSAADCAEAEQRDAAFTTVVNAAADLYAGAGQAVAQAEARAEEHGEALLQAAADFAEDEAEDPPARIGARHAFGEALRLRDEALAKEERRESRKELRLRPLREALEQARAGTAQARRIEHLLQDDDGAPRRPSDA